MVTGCGVGDGIGGGIGGGKGGGNGGGGGVGVGRWRIPCGGLLGGLRGAAGRVVSSPLFGGGDGRGGIGPVASPDQKQPYQGYLSCMSSRSDPCRSLHRIYTGLPG
jgi:hypothetical protein